MFPDLKDRVIADLFEDAAAARAKECGVVGWGGVDAALNHPDVEIIVNLTIPAAHVEVAPAAVHAGKHVWTETFLAGPRLRTRAAQGGRRAAPRTLPPARGHKLHA